MIERLDMDIDGHGWHPDGAPSIALFASAVQVWAIAQESADDVTIDAAALAFNVEPELMRRELKELGL